MHSEGSTRSFGGQIFDFLFLVKIKIKRKIFVMTQNYMFFCRMLKKNKLWIGTERPRARAIGKACKSALNGTLAPQFRF